MGVKFLGLRFPTVFDGIENNTQNLTVTVLGNIMALAVHLRTRGMMRKTLACAWHVSPFMEMEIKLPTAMSGAALQTIVDA